MTTLYDYVTLREMGAMCGGLHIQTMRRLANAGRFPTTRFGPNRHHLVARAAAETFASQYNPSQGPKRWPEVIA